MGDAYAQSSMPPDAIRVAVTQAEPEWLDLQASVKKTCRLIEEAAENGAKLVSFPECWIPGYPAWVWSRPVDFELCDRYMQNSLPVESLEMEAIQACARKHKMTVALGFSENFHHSLYISQCTIGSTGEILMHRRKILPTHMERTIFGNASGSSLKNVVATDVGQVSQLACWEHTQPLLKYHTITQRAAFHVASWPPVPPCKSKDELWSMSREGARNLARTYAIESGSFVLHNTGVIGEKGINLMRTSGGAVMNTPGGGSSAIYGPDGRQISEDVDETQEGIIYADLDVGEIRRAKSFLDIVGHYSRPDLLWLGADGSEKVPLKV